MKHKKDTKHQPLRRNPVPEKKAPSARWKAAAALAGILLITLLVFLPVLQNNFVNYDDPTYILKNTLIKNLSWKSIQSIFGNLQADNYAPLTDFISAIQI